MLKERKLRLITKATQRHPGRIISLCGDAECWDDCFTEEKTTGLVFWYNVGKDTRAIAEKSAV